MSALLALLWGLAVLGAPPPRVAAPAVFGRAWRGSRRRSTLRRAAEAVVAELPEVVDLLALVVGAGANVARAVEVVAPRAPPTLGAAFLRAAADAAAGRRLADALAEIPTVVGEGARPLVAVLVDTERYGAPLLPALERLGADSRAQRRRAAEEAARRVPVALLFPLVLCVLPAFVVLTLVPLLAGALGSLGR